MSERILRIAVFSFLSSVVCVAESWSQGSTNRVNISSEGRQAHSPCYEPQISADGRYVVFMSPGSGLVDDDTNGVVDVFVHDRLTGQLERASVDSSGIEANGECIACGISGDGRVVVFTSWATNLVPGIGGLPLVYVHDRQTGQTSCASVDSLGTAGNLAAFRCAISADGLVVAFESSATNLVSGDTNDKLDVFVHDRANGQTTRVDVSSAGEEATTDTSCHPGCLSGDGRYVVFDSYASNLVANDANETSDVFVHDRLNAETTRVSVSSTGAEGDLRSYRGCISSDGSTVVFSSEATQLVPGDTNHAQDVFARDRLHDLTELVSVASDGSQAEGRSGITSWMGVSSDGGIVVFDSEANNLVPADGNADLDVFLRDRLAATTIRVSVDSGGGEGDGGSSTLNTVSADGSLIAFESYATDLIAWDTNTQLDVFVHDRFGCSIPVVSYCSPSTTSIPSCQAFLTSSGVPSFSDPTSFTVSASSVPGGSNFGLAYFGVNGPNHAPFGSQGGMLCVKSPFFRGVPKPSGGTAGSCNGHYDYDLAALIARGGGKIVAGATVHVAIWFRDPASPDHFGLSDGLWFFVCP